MSRSAIFFALAFLALFPGSPARGEILWSDPASRVIHATPDGTDILGGKVKRDDTASDVLYFKFHVDPLSDPKDEPYYALFQLCEGNECHLAVGNAMEAWGYSACYVSQTGPSNQKAKKAEDAGEWNLKSAHPEAVGLGEFQPYELPNHNHEKTIVFKVQFVPGGDDLVTVWLDPDLTHGATAENQPENLTTKFKANASFNQIRLRHAGFSTNSIGNDNKGGNGGIFSDTAITTNDKGGNGWNFSEMAIATSFSDFVVVRFWQTWWFFAMVALGLLGGVGATVRIVEKRKFQFQLQQAEQQHALEQERARIARDLHDELGSLLTRISLLGGLLRSDKDNPEHVEAHAGKISQSADQTVRALEEIVWAVRPGSDTLQSLIEYITHFANELFDGSNTRCRLDLSQDLPAIALPPDVRHNIFLIIKEALTNALKHAAAREVRVAATAAGSTIEIVVADDGKGFTPAIAAATGRRNGLGNMRQRAEDIGAMLDLQSSPGSGTSVRLTVNLPGGQRPA
jgi:signal transduction histidine kinase